MNKKLILLIVTLVTTFSLYAQDSVTYVIRNGHELKMDIYQASPDNRQPEVIMYLYGGSFMNGERKDMDSICEIMSAKGFTCVAIDYRKLLREAMKNDTLNLNLRFLEQAIGAVVEDISSAVLYLKVNGARWGIDADHIILAGSSAGAIAALQADWSLQNGYKWTKELPSGYRFAGVMAYAGAIYSRKGKPHYKHNPAPTMMYHGTKDKVAPYNKISIFNYYYGGSNALGKIFQKKGYTAKIVRFKGSGHEVCGYYKDYVDDAIDFITRYVRGGETGFEDKTLEDIREKKEKTDESNEKPKHSYVIMLSL